jgi:tripartite-type tricarboxylate transporter receptor subunit TctC
MLSKALATWLGAAVTLGASAVGHAQDYPVRPIRAIATTSAGGISDLFMRALGEELHKRLGQPVIVENRPGGANNLGTRACADAAPDGYTICITQTEPIVYNQFLYKNLGYNPETGLAPVSNLFFISQVLFTNAKLGVKSVDELVALSKAKAGTLSYLAPSPVLYLYMEWLKEQKGADWVRVPFKGGGEAVNAVMNESTPVALLGVGNIIGNIQSGLFTPLAIANEVRSPLLLNVPTIVELGYQGPPSRDWFGLFAPAATPAPIVARLSKEVQSIMADAAFQEKNLVSRGLIPAASTPEAFAEMIKRDRVIAAQVVKDAQLEMR